MIGTPLQRHRQRIDRRHVASAMLTQHRVRHDAAWRDLIALFQKSDGKALFD